MEMKSLLVWSAVAASAAVFATPSVSVTGIATNSAGDVVVSYTLSGEDAIITCETFVDGVSVGRHFTGDANRRVAQGARSFVWSPRSEGVTVRGEVSAKVTAWTFDNPPDYLVIGLASPKVRRYYASAEMLPFPTTNDVYKTGMMLMRKIPAKNVVWRMGQDDDNCGINSSDLTQTKVRDKETPHMVKLTKDFYMGVYLVTHCQYAARTGLAPSYYKTTVLGNNGNAALLPVENVSYDTLRGAESATFLNWPLAGHAVAPDSVLATIRAFTGVSTLDLPTEAQWEYACRAGTATALNSGRGIISNSSTAGDANFADVGWSQYSSSYDSRAANHTMEVGLLAPNNWGLYDMHGNVFERCLDRYVIGDDYRATFESGWEDGAVTVDPVGPSTSTVTNCTVRGSSCFYVGGYGRSASRVMGYARSLATKHAGVRFVCNLPIEE